MLKRNQPILIAGLGSIGRRHLQNLLSLGCNNIILYRTGKSTLPDDELKDFCVEYSLKDGLSHRPIGVIVSNPPTLHLSTALAAAQADCHLFIEKPIFHSIEGAEELVREVKNRNLSVLVGFQFRFHPALRQIKRWLDSGRIGKVASCQAHWGEYLPGWHPWEDYRKGYSARQDLGGGVILTLCHPFDYLRWLIGEVRSVSAAAGRLGGLEIDVEDTACVILHFVQGAIASFCLDYLQRPRRHWLRIVGQKGAIDWDDADGIAHLYRAGSKEEEFIPPEGFKRNTMFLEEMSHFLNCLSGKEKPACGLGDGIRALEIALAAKKSAVERREIDVSRA